MHSSIWKLLTAVGIIGIGTLVVLQVQHRLPGMRSGTTTSVLPENAGEGQETSFVPDASTELDSVLTESSTRQTTAAAQMPPEAFDSVGGLGEPAPPSEDGTQLVARNSLTDEPNPFELGNSEESSDSTKTPQIQPVSFEDEQAPKGVAESVLSAENDPTSEFPADEASPTSNHSSDASKSSSKQATGPSAMLFFGNDNSEAASDNAKDLTASNAQPETDEETPELPMLPADEPEIRAPEKSSGSSGSSSDLSGRTASGEPAASDSLPEVTFDEESTPLPADSDTPSVVIPEPVPDFSRSTPAAGEPVKTLPETPNFNPFEDDGGAGTGATANPPKPKTTPKAKSVPAAETAEAPVFNPDEDRAQSPPQSPAAKSGRKSSPEIAADPGKTRTFRSEKSEERTSPSRATADRSERKGSQRPITQVSGQQGNDPTLFEIDARDSGSSAEPSPRRGTGAGEAFSEDPDAGPGSSTRPDTTDEFPVPEYSGSRTERRNESSSPSFGDNEPFEPSGNDRDRRNSPRTLPTTDEEPLDAASDGSGRSLGPASNRTVSEVMRPQLSIQKKAPESAAVGISHEYLIRVSNEGDSPAYDVIVDDELGLAAEYISSRPVAEYNQSTGQLSWNFAELAPRETREITVRIKPTGEGTLDGVATVRFKAQVRSATVIKSPRLELELTGPAEVKVGDEVQLQFIISNRGSGDASDVVLRSVLPPGLRHPEGGDLEYEIDVLPAGKSETVDLTVVAAEPGDQIRVSAELTSAGLPATTARTDVHIVGAQLSIERLGPEKRFVGRSARFQNIITNDTNFEAVDAVVIEQVPDGMKFLSASNGGVFNQETRRVRWDIPRLAPGKQTILEVELMAETAGQMESMVEITESAGFRTRADENTTVLVEDLHNVTADISRQDKPVAIGESFGFTITIDNRGTAVARNIEMAVHVPPEIKVLAAGTREVPGKLVEGNIVRFASVQAIRPNEKLTFRVKLQGQQAIKNAVVQALLKYDEMSEPLIVSESVTVFDDQL